jgi:hypothetical protein
VWPVAAKLHLLGSTERKTLMSVWMGKARMGLWLSDASAFYVALKNRDDCQLAFYE